MLDTTKNYGPPTSDTSDQLSSLAGFSLNYLPPKLIVAVALATPPGSEPVQMYVPRSLSVMSGMIRTPFWSRALDGMVPLSLVHDRT